MLESSWGEHKVDVQQQKVNLVTNICTFSFVLLVGCLDLEDLCFFFPTCNKYLLFQVVFFPSEIHLQH